jgi:hypothetical protein
MELNYIKLINGQVFSLGVSFVTGIYMFNNETSFTIVHAGDKVIANIPYHSVLYYVLK